MGRLRGSLFIPPHMQQMKLCTSDIPTNAIAGQRMDIAVADFMHSHMLPFSLTECPKFLKLLNTAKSLGTGYLPPDRRKMSGPLLDMLYDTNKEEMIKNLLLESKIFGVTIFGDGATITNVPLMNILAASPNNLFALLEIVDCTDQMAKGGKKDVRYLSDFVRPIVKWLEATAKSNIVDLIMLDGASNIQLDICWVHKPNECRMGGELISLLHFLCLKDALRSTINSKEFLDLNNFKEECCVLNNNNFWMYFFKLYLYVLQRD